MFVYLGAMQSLVCKTDVFMLLLFNVYKCGFLNSMSLFLSFFNFFFFFLMDQNFFTAFMILDDPLWAL